MSIKNVDYQCPECGSDNIGIHPTQYWNKDGQYWGGGFEVTDGDCGDCDHQAVIEEFEIELNPQ